MKVRRGRKAAAVVFAASVAASGIVVLVPALTAEAADPVLTIPGRLYPEVGAIMDFDGSADPVSDDPRSIDISGFVEGSVGDGCNPSAANDYDADDCPGVDLSLSTTKAGLLRLTADITEVDLSQPADGIPEVLFVDDGDVVMTATDDFGLDSQAYTLRGTDAGVLAILDTLQFVPCSEQVGTLKDPAPVDPAESIYEVNCGDLAGDPDDEPVYQERESADGLLPNLFVRAIQGDDSGTNPTGNIYLKIEGTNTSPTLNVTTSPVDASADGTTDVDGNVSVLDDEMCNDLDCPGEGYDTPGLSEGDDEMLLIAWIDESSCGTFNFLSSIFLSPTGGPTLTSVAAVLRDWARLELGLDLNDTEQNAAAVDIAAGVAATLSLDALALNLTTQPSSADSETTVFAGIGEISEVRDALATIDYNAPADDATCHLNFEVSDLGNNGRPLEYVGSPFGPEVPHGGATPVDVPYEVPNALSDTGQVEFNVTDTHPDVTVEQTLPGPLGSPAGPNKPASFTVTFSEPVDGFADADLDFSDSTASGVSGSVQPSLDNQTFIVIATANDDSDGDDIILKIPAGVATAQAAPNDTNDASTSSDNEIEWDQLEPTVTINKKVGQADPTNASPILFTVEFSDLLTTGPIVFEADDIDLSDSTVGGTPVVSDVSMPNVSEPKIWEVQVTGMSGVGDVIAKVNAGAVVDTAGNQSLASTSTDNIVTFDDDDPGVTITPKAGQPDPTSVSPIEFTVQFDEAVTGFAGNDISFAGSTAGGTLAANVTGGPMIYDVVVSGMTTSGNVTTSVNSDAAFDAAGNGNTAAPGSATVAWVQVVDTTDPTVTIAKKSGQADPTGTAPIEFTVTFSEPVSGFVDGEVSFTGSTAGGSLASDVTGGPSVYNVAVTGMTTPGNVVASINAGVAMDAAANPNEASPGSATVAWDATAPTVTIDQAGGQGDPTTGTPILFTVVFSEPVSDFATGDVTLTGSAGATTAIVSGSSMNYTVAVSGMTVDGTVTAAINAGVAHDAANNPNTASTSTDNTVTFDLDEGDATSPSVTITQGATQDDPTSLSPIVFDVAFSEPVADFATGDVTVAGTAGATTGVVTGSGMNYTVSVSGMVSNGTITVSIAAGVAHDAANNPNTASTSADDTVTFDTLAPSVTIDKKAAQADPTNASPILFTVTFSEAVTGFVTGDVTLGGTANPTTATVTPVSTSVYDVAVTGMSGPGTVTATVGASEAVDLANNANTAAPAAAQVTFDNVAPTVTINQSGAVDPTTASPIVFDVVFSESVADFATGDVALSGSAGATTAVVSGSGTTYTVSVSGMTHDGTVTAAINAGVAHDAATNANAASTSTDNTVTFDFDEGDITAPTVTINRAAAQADPSTGASILFTVTFSEAVVGFTGSDVVLSGTAGATTASVSGAGPTYTVTVTGVTQAGTVTASIPAGAAADAANNANTASTSADNTVTFVQPTIAVSTPGGTVQVTVISGGVLTAASGAAPQVPPPNGVVFPFGQLSFTASSAPGALVVFQLTLPSPVTTYYKLVSGAWQEFTFDNETGAQVSGNTITVRVRDNGRGDSDATSGVVTDPGAPAVLAQVPTTTTTTTPTTSPTTAPGTLPPTGSSSTNDVLVVASLLFGVGLLLAGTRRRQSRSAKA